MIFRKNRTFSVVMVLLAFWAQSLFAVGLPCPAEADMSGWTVSTDNQTVEHPEHCQNSKPQASGVDQESCCTSDCNCPAGCSSLPLISLQQHAVPSDSSPAPKSTRYQLLSAHSTSHFRPPISG